MENTVGLTLGHRAVDVCQVTGQGHTLSTGAPVLASRVGSLRVPRGRARARRGLTVSFLTGLCSSCFHVEGRSPALSISAP